MSVPVFPFAAAGTGDDVDDDRASVMYKVAAATNGPAVELLMHTAPRVLAAAVGSVNETWRELSTRPYTPTAAGGGDDSSALEVRVPQALAMVTTTTALPVP